jgi:hypothetical protein
MQSTARRWTNMPIHQLQVLNRSALSDGCLGHELSEGIEGEYDQVSFEREGEQALRQQVSFRVYLSASA